MNNINSMRRNLNLYNFITNNYYDDLGVVEFEYSEIDTFRFSVKPYQGFHKDIKYSISLKFEDNNFPKIYIDSPLFNKIKTSQYYTKINHNGICIKYISYGYGFETNFKKFCDNKWENYLYYLISTFNNIEDFEKGVGIKSNYKNILGIN